MTVVVIFLLFLCYLCPRIKNDQSVTFMENKPYERTQRSFNYTPASIFTNQWSNLAFGVGMIVIPAIFPFRPPYPTSAYSLACGILDDSDCGRRAAALLHLAKHAQCPGAEGSGRSSHRRRQPRNLSRSREGQGRIPFVPYKPTSNTSRTTRRSTSARSRHLTTISYSRPNTSIHGRSSRPSAHFWDSNIKNIRI